MASANVSFDNIPASIRKPGKYFEYNTKLAVRTLATNPQTVLIVAQKTAEGTAPENAPVRVFDTDMAGKLFGFGSQAARMVRAAMRAYGYVDLSVLPVADDSAGIAASGSLKLTGDATAQGVITLTVADMEVAIAAAAGDAAASLATALASAVNAERDMPVTAQAATGTVTLTAKNKGTLGNGIALSYACTVPGITPTLAKMTGGQKDPDITDALTAVFAADYTIYCVPWAAQAPLTILREHLDNVSGPLEQRGAIGVYASTGTLSAATTLAGQLNAGRITGAVLPGSATPAEQIAAAYAAVLASEEDPARPLNTLALTGVTVPPVASRLGRTEQEVCLKNGVTPLEYGPGDAVQIVRAISTYTVNAEGVADVSLLDITTIRTLDYVRRALRERVSLRFPREKLSTRTPPKVRSELLDVLRKLEQLEIVEEVEANADGVVVERDVQDANRLDAKIPVDVVNGLHIFAGRIDLLL